MDNQAATQVYAFLIAGVVFVASVGFILFLSQEEQSNANFVAETGKLDAKSLGEILLESPGIGTGGDPDDVVRLGLQESGRNLSTTQLESLRGANFSSQSNDKVDYEDAKAGLGFTDQDFHLRIYPNALQLSLQYANLTGVRTAYIGEWDTFASVTVPLGTDEDMKADAQTDLDAQAFLGTLDERVLIDSTGFNFNNQVFITSGYPTVLVDLHPLPDLPLIDVLAVPLIEGDVYPDDKQYLDNILTPRLAGYDVLIVGSGVDQQAMTSAVTKNGIRDFVLAGGSLIVLGTDKQNVQWLRPIFDAGVTTANGGSMAPDPSHPLLTEPNVLSYSDYDNFGFAWDLQDADTIDRFQHVVQLGGDDELAVSNDGAYGDGRIFLSSYWPSDIEDNIGTGEALGFLTNIALYEDREGLYLDYGETIPDGRDVAVYVREMTVWDDRLGQVPVVVELFVWS